LIHIWDSNSGEQIQSLPADQVVSVGFNRSGTLLASAGWDGKMRLWDFVNSRQLVSIYRAGFINYFSPDDKELVCGRWDGTGLDFFEVGKGEGLRTIHQHETGPEESGGTVIFSKSGRLLAFTVSTGTRLWDLRAGRELDAMAGENLTPLGFDTDEKNLLLTSSQGLFRLPINQSPAEETAVGVAVPIPVQIPGRSGRVSTDGKTCVLVGVNHAEIFETTSFGAPVRTADQPGMRFVALAPDGLLLASGAWHRTGVVVWDAKTGLPIKELPTDDEAATVAFSPDGQRLVVSTKRFLHFLDVGSWSTVLQIPQQAGNDFSSTMAFSQDGSVFAATHSRSVVRLFDARTGKVLADLESPDSRMVTGLCFNADGGELAMGEGKGAVRIWDLRLIREHLATMGLDWNTTPYPPLDVPSQAASAATLPR
jgi:WD40 repeat protein